MLELLKKIIEAMREERLLAKARKELLKDKLRESYLQAVIDKYLVEQGLSLKIDISFNNGADNMHIEAAERSEHKRDSFWNKYHKAQSALGNAN